MPQRRFIAGAKCPACNTADKTVVFSDDNDGQVRECIACGHRELLDELGQQQELPTRVAGKPEQSTAGDSGEVVSVVTILDPRKK